MDGKSIQGRVARQRTSPPALSEMTNRIESNVRGPVAQLGARMNGIHEVTGSIPVWSTSFLTPRFGELVSW